MRYINRILAFLLAGCVLMSGCGKERPIETVESTEELSSEEYNGETQESIAAAPNLPAMEALTWENKEDTNLAGLLQENGASMMVQLEAGGHIGSGVLLTVEEEQLIIITAAHVLENAQDYVRVTFFDDYGIVSRDYELFPENDIGIVRLDWNDIPAENGKNYCHALVSYERYDRLEAGDTCIAMGSLTGVAEEAYEGTVQDPMVLIEDYKQYMILVQCEGKPGMSGGGLFDEEGYLIGILSGVNEAGQVACIPLHTIRNIVNGILNISL